LDSFGRAVILVHWHPTGLNRAVPAEALQRQVNHRRDEQRDGLDYAQRLKALADEVQDQLFVVMRVYFEKPRTTVGWKGLINDPYMDDALAAAKLPVNIVVDCSHANSRKNHNLQSLVLKDVVGQLVDGNRAVKGVMLESNLFEGNQKLGNLKDLRYGVSITDACLGWQATETGLREAASRLRCQDN
jgi:3-deoxy-D-arabino-heptulosonate 7-phosphate (DAHP) synthase